MLAKATPSRSGGRAPRAPPPLPIACAGTTNNVLFAPVGGFGGGEARARGFIEILVALDSLVAGGFLFGGGGRCSGVAGGGAAAAVVAGRSRASACVAHAG